MNYFKDVIAKDELNQLVKSLDYYIFRYGVENVGIKHPEKYNTYTSSQRSEFISSCNDGYKKAQKIIIDKILYFEDIEHS